jgi:hypothetical protein
VINLARTSLLAKAKESEMKIAERSFRLLATLPVVASPARASQLGK